jgi:hypothetical protein
VNDLVKEIFLDEKIIKSKIAQGDTINIKLDKKADELKIDVVPGELESKTEK